MKYIYCITNLINEKTYLGKRTLPKNTLLENDDYYGSGILINRSIQKYGIENFSKDILVFGEFSTDEINEYERYYISLYKLNGKAEYNITKGGDGGKTWQNIINKKGTFSTKGKTWEEIYGPKRTKQRKENMKISHITEYGRFSISNKMKGEFNPINRFDLSEKQKLARENFIKLSKQPKSKEWKKQAAELKLKEKNPMYGKHWKNSSKEKIRIANGHQVKCIETNQIFNSLREAALQTGICRIIIAEICKGKRENYNDFHFTYLS
jgi:group I intron endonuclease